MGNYKKIINLIISVILHKISLAAGNLFYIEEISASHNISHYEQRLGEELLKAFNSKSVENIDRLIKKGAPVYYRLDYGLPLIDETDFVASFYVLLGGLDREENILEGAKLLLPGGNKAQDLYNYVKTAFEIFNIFHAPYVNSCIVPLNPKFEEYLYEKASTLRANPHHENGALIIAAGLKNPKLLREIIEIGQNQDTIVNGASVNFKGYFGDTAAVWSTILLDKDSLELLLTYKPQVKDLGLTRSSLLHWAVCAGRLDHTPERFEKTQNIIKLLLAYDPSLINEKNALGKIPYQYANQRIKPFLARD